MVQLCDLRAGTGGHPHPGQGSCCRMCSLSAPRYLTWTGNHSWATVTSGQCWLGGPSWSGSGSVGPLGASRCRYRNPGGQATTKPAPSSVEPAGWGGLEAALWSRSVPSVLFQRPLHGPPHLGQQDGPRLRRRREAGPLQHRPPRPPPRGWI